MPQERPHRFALTLFYRCKVCAASWVVATVVTHGSRVVPRSPPEKSSRWRQALTEMVAENHLCGWGCRQQQLGKEHCEKKRSALWTRLADLKLLGKTFGAFKSALLDASVRRLAALRDLREACDDVSGLERTDGYARRRLRREVGVLRAGVEEDQIANRPGGWLLLRAWLAWRLMLARGGGRSGRRILHGARRDHLREQLLQVALGEQREVHLPATQLVDLCAARSRAWRRWLSLGGWGAFDKARAQLATRRGAAGS